MLSPFTVGFHHEDRHVSIEVNRNIDFIFVKTFHEETIELKRVDDGTMPLRWKEAEKKVEDFICTSDSHDEIILNRHGMVVNIQDQHKSENISYFVYPLHLNGSFLTHILINVNQSTDIRNEHKTSENSNQYKIRMNLEANVTTWLSVDAALHDQKQKL